MLVADNAGQVVATLDIVVVTVLTDGAAPTAVIMNIVVDRLHRRTGIGRALMAAAVSHARSACCAMVELSSSKERVRPIASTDHSDSRPRRRVPPTPVTSPLQ